MADITKNEAKATKKDEKRYGKLIASAIKQLELAAKGYDYVSETVTKQTFDENNKLINTVVTTKKTKINLDAKDAIKLLSTLSPDFRPGYAKPDDDAEAKLDAYR